MTDVARYGSFLNETNKLPKCKSFCIFLSWEPHALVPVMLHLLRSCNDTKKLRVHLFGPSSRREVVSKTFRFITCHKIVDCKL